MNKIILLISVSFFLNQLFAQTTPADIRLESKVVSESIEMRDFMDFEGINYYHLKFTGKDLKDKAYEIRKRH